MILYFILLAIFSGWAIFILRFMHNLFNVKLKSIENQDPNIDERFKPFERIDRKQWNLPEMYFCSVFLLPIKCLIIVFSMIALSLFHKIVVGDLKQALNKEYHPLQRMILKKSTHIVSSIVLLCSGIYKIEKKNLKIKDFDQEYAQQNILRQDKAPIIVSNHISFLDIVYHTNSDIFPSFLSKQQILNSLIGPTAAALQCIFVDRFDRQSKDDARKLINKRVQLTQEGKNFSPLLIFPEGTTTNGRYIISFKRGAFESLFPVKIICLQYPIRYLIPTYDILDEKINIILLLCQFKINLTVFEFDTFFPDYLNLSTSNEKDWEIYARKVKNIMLKALNMQNSKAGLRDRVEYSKFMKKQNKQEQ